jgi:hypothetical protein
MMLLVEFALGRMVLHVCCILRGGRWDYHWAGVWREIRQVCEGMLRFARCGRKFLLERRVL